MTLLVERKLPGYPIPRKRLVAEWEDMHPRNLTKGPVASFLFDVHYGAGKEVSVALRASPWGNRPLDQVHIHATARVAFAWPHRPGNRSPGSS